MCLSGETSVLYVVEMIHLQAHQESAVAARDAQAAYDMANQAKNLSMGEMSRVNDLVKEITDFRAEKKATPEGIAAIADEVN